MVSQETGGNNMIAELLGDQFKLFNVEYEADRHTFAVTWGPKNSASPHSRSPLSYTNFPNHHPLTFLDEKVRIHEEVMIWIKDECLLKHEGWEEYRDGHRMRSDNSPFVIGKDKRKLLGTGVKAFIGVDEQLRPYAVYREWRFSPNEIKTVLRLNFTEPLKFTEIATADGMLTVFADNRTVQLPDGHIIPTKWLPALKELCRMAGV